MAFTYPILCEQCGVTQVGEVSFEQEQTPEVLAEKTKGYICAVRLPVEQPQQEGE